MKVLIFTSFFFLCVYFLSSCKPYCGLANYGSQGSYLTKPVYKDTNQTATYANGQYYQNGGHGYSFSGRENMIFGDVAAYKSHTGKYYNISYGSLLYGGNYTVNGVKDFNGTKSFIGLGLMGEANLTIPTKYIDFRIVGFRITGIHESGEYTKFRKDADRENKIEDLHPCNTAINTSLTTEIIVKLKQVNFGAYLRLGTIYSLGDYSNISASTGVFLNKNHLTGSFQVTRLGFFPAAVVSFGLSYHIK